MSNIRLIDRVKAKVVAWAIRDPSASLYERFAKWFSPTNIFTRRSSYTLASNETIFSAVSRLSNSIGALPLKLLDKNFQQVTDHQAAELLMYQPNPNMTSFDFLRTMEAIRNTEGNAYAIKEYDMMYQPRALWVLDPNKVEPVIEADTKELWYEIQGDNGTYYVHNLDIIHLKHVHGYGYKGISPIKVLANTIDFDSKVKHFSLDQMDTAVRASFILEMAGTLSDTKKKEVLTSFANFYKENGGVLIQEMGTKITPIDRKFLDTKVFEAEKITRTRVASVYNMPVHMLGETDGVNYASMEQMALEYVQNTLTPIVTQYEKELNRKLLTKEDRRKGLYFKFNLNALLRGDMKTRGDFYFKGVRSMLFKPNEIRAWEDLPPEPGGDKLYVSGDLYPVDQPRQKGGSG